MCPSDSYMSDASSVQMTMMMNYINQQGMLVVMLAI